MSIQRVYTIFLRQMFLIRRSFHRLLGIFYWSVLELFLWGFLTAYLTGIGKDRFSFITVVIGTVILWNFLNRVQQGVAISFLEDIWSRNFLNLFGSPLRLNEYIGGLILVSIVSSVVSIIVMTAIAWFLFSYNLFQFGFLMIPFIFILFFFGLALGLYTTAMILRFGPSSEILAWSIPALIPPFSGVFYPVATLPVWIQYIAYVIPSSYIFEGMRAVVLSGVFETHLLLFAAGLSLLYTAIAFYLVHRSYRYVLRNGLITRIQVE